MQLFLQNIMPPHAAVGSVVWDAQKGTLSGVPDLVDSIKQAARIAAMQGYLRPAPTLPRVEITEPLKHADQLAAVLAFVDYRCEQLPLEPAEPELQDSSLAIVY